LEKADAFVAGRAERTAHLSGLVVVVNDKPEASETTDGAAALVFDQTLELLARDAVFAYQPLV